MPDATTPDSGPSMIPVLDMASPMLGFPEHHRFALARLDEEGTVCDLRSLEDTDSGRSCRPRCSSTTTPRRSRHSVAESLRRVRRRPGSAGRGDSSASIR